METKQNKLEQIDLKAVYEPEYAAGLLRLDTATLQGYIDRKLITTDDRGRVPGYALLRLKAGVLAHMQSDIEYKINSPAYETKGR